MNNIDLDLIKEQNEYSLHKNKDSGKYFISKINNNPHKQVIERENFKIYTHVINDEEKENKIYEVLEILNITYEPFVFALFNFISDIDEPIEKSIKQIESFLANNIEVSLAMARGLFAELYSLSKDKELKIKHENAIYDFTKKDNDVEIKSYSASLPKIIISKQQALNSKNAILMCLEVIETNEGKSVKELIASENINHKRYDWIKTNKSTSLDIRFKTNDSWEVNMNSIFDELKLPDIIDNAKFELNAKRIKSTFKS